MVGYFIIEVSEVFSQNFITDIVYVNIDDDYA